MVKFEPYGGEELRAILERRCEKAPEAKTVSEEVIPEVVERVTESRVNVNVALNLLKSSMRLAERENSKVTEGHVSKSYENLKNILGDIDGQNSSFTI